MLTCSDGMIDGGRIGSRHALQIFIAKHLILFTTVPGFRPDLGVELLEWLGRGHCNADLQRVHQHVDVVLVR